MTANSKANFSPLLDIINALQTMLARSEPVIIPDLETPCSRFPNTDQSATHNDQSVRAIITERQQQLDIVLQQISGLETVMDTIKKIEQQLVVKKERITESMNLHKGLVSSLWRLPTEIMSQIFHHCLPESGHSSEPDAPLLLTGVCRRWREVVVCIPSLWCRLHIRPSQNRWEQQGPICDLWLKRSQGRPLSLALFCEHSHATEIQSLLHPYSNQITSLSVTAYDDATQISVDAFPALQEFAIKVIENDEESVNYIPVVEKILRRLPSTLHSLKVVDEFFYFVPLSSLSTVGAHLTNLDISTLRRQGAVLDLLKLCPNLLSLKIRALSHNRKTLEPFTHTNIQTFRIEHEFHEIHPFFTLFDALSFPSLRVLEVYHILGESCPHAVLKAFLARSKCPLESLIFCRRNSRLKDEERAGYIALIPSLDILRGTDVPSNKVLFVKSKDEYF